MIELLRSRFNKLGYYYMNDGRKIEDYIISMGCFTFDMDRDIYIGRDIKLGDITLTGMFKDDIVKAGISPHTGELIFILPGSITKK